MAIMTLTLYQAIEKKKIYEDRLKKFDIKNKLIFGKYSEGNKVINGLTLEEAGKVMKSNFQSFIHLQSNIVALQRAINKANLENKVSVEGYRNNEEVALVELVTEKQKLDSRKSYLNSISRQLEDIKKSIDSENKRILDPDYMNSQIAKHPGTDKKSENSVEVLAQNINNYIEQNTVKLFDPNEIVSKEWIENQVKEIENFQTNLHYSLMKANTSIIIEVDLED